MKKSGRNIIKSIAFALVAVMIMGVLGAAFTPKRSDPGSGITNSNARGFYGEPKNSIDVLVLGDSNAYSACSPMYIWNKYGIPTYVAAEGFQNVTGASNLLDEVLQGLHIQVSLKRTVSQHGGQAVFRPEQDGGNQGC